MNFERQLCANGPLTFKLSNASADDTDDQIQPQPQQAIEETAPEDQRRQARTQRLTEPHAAGCDRQRRERSRDERTADRVGRRNVHRENESKDARMHIADVARRAAFRNLAFANLSFALSEDAAEPAALLAGEVE
ncbi:MAG: hypothetical protein WAV27_00945 [Xanthobacteraceae bacterium]